MSHCFNFGNLLVTTKRVDKKWFVYWKTFNQLLPLIITKLPFAEYCIQSQIVQKVCQFLACRLNNMPPWPLHLLLLLASRDCTPLVSISELCNQTVWSCKALIHKTDVRASCQMWLPRFCFALVRRVKVVNHDWLYWGGIVFTACHWTNQTKTKTRIGWWITDK